MNQLNEQHETYVQHIKMQHEQELSIQIDAIRDELAASMLEKNVEISSLE